MTDNYDLIFEIGTEELPQAALKNLSDNLKKEFLHCLDAHDLKYSEAFSFSAPRRLALFVEKLQAKQSGKKFLRKGPSIKAAFDDSGNPTKAALGFAHSCGVSITELKRSSDDKGEWLYFEEENKGKLTQDLLADIAKTAVSSIHMPKKMRWGSSESQFIRPVKWILFKYGDKLIDCNLFGIKSGQITYGHRFHFPGSIKIDRPKEYSSLLENPGKVIASFSSRKKKIETFIKEAAEEAGGNAIYEESLLEEVCSLCDWPVPIVGTFEEKFLEIPSEILILTMKKNQKYFPIVDENKNLKNSFITIANIESKNPTIIKEGNERVIRPRFADAMFFWQQDKKISLEDHGSKLGDIIFQKQLGSMAEKTERITLLAIDIAKEINGDTELISRAGKLSRCDLLSETVNEFPSMQGIMGRYIAAIDGENEEVSKALEEFYLPRFSGDRLPKTKTGIAISLADKLDTLIGIFGAGLKPTGDKDPYGLRRAAIGVIRILRENISPIKITLLLETGIKNYEDKKISKTTFNDVNKFILERLKSVYIDEGVSVDVFDSVVFANPSNLLDFDLRIKAIVKFINSKEAPGLCSINKRIKNILKKNSYSSSKIDKDIFKSNAEENLYNKIISVENSIKPLMDKADYSSIFGQLITLQSTVDRFFDETMVMVDDKKIRDNRLSLLNKLHLLFLDIADISLLQTKEN